MRGGNQDDDAHRTGTAMAPAIARWLPTMTMFPRPSSVAIIGSHEGTIEFSSEPGGELVEESVGPGRYRRILTILSAAELQDFEEWC